MSGRVVVTGSSSGVGLACTRMLPTRGWEVIGLDRADPVAPSDVEVGETIRCDVADAGQVDAAFAAIRARHGTIDALVCSAGILRVGPLESMPVEAFDALFAVNTRGAWLCARAALPMLKAAATALRPARIVFISSVAVFRPKPGTGAYSASKAALSQITRVLAGEVAASHVLVNALAPGAMDTPMTRDLRAGGPEKYRRSAVPPIGRDAEPDDVAAAVAMLLSAEQRYITGVTIPVDGGSSAIYVPPEP